MPVNRSALEPHVSAGAVPTQHGMLEAVLLGEALEPKVEDANVVAYEQYAASRCATRNECAREGEGEGWMRRDVLSYSGFHVRGPWGLLECSREDEIVRRAEVSGQRDSGLLCNGRDTTDSIGSD